jgi:hypothetical protein
LIVPNQKRGGVKKGYIPDNFHSMTSEGVKDIARYSMVWFERKEEAVIDGVLIGPCFAKGLLTNNA